MGKNDRQRQTASSAVRFEDRTARATVLWRRTSFGSQSEAGSVFVTRMLTLVSKGSSSPSLLPQESPSTESMPLAA
ncbi:MAG: hypothetical protein ACK47N_13120 [Microcystis sp.]|uniref:hypothetical protein n=1 Tax=Microcystis sp. TaxID=1127 RepID=UPI00391D49CB